MRLLDALHPAGGEHCDAPEHEGENEGGHGLLERPVPGERLQADPYHRVYHEQQESEHHVAQALHGLDVAVDGLVHGLHVSSDERVHGRVEDLGEQEQALDVGVGLAVLP